MKTLELKLKKINILIVEPPQDTSFDVLINNRLWKDGIKFLTGKEEKLNFIKGKFRFICQGRYFKEYISEAVEASGYFWIENHLGEESQEKTFSPECLIFEIL